MRVELTKEFRFEAAHRLPMVPPDHKCHRLHGHSYKIVVVCRGPLDERGFVVDYAEISAAVRPITDGMLDHRNLDDVLRDGRGGPSTAENLAAWLYPQIKKALPMLYQIEVHETATTVVRYPVYPNASGQPRLAQKGHNANQDA
jgi:6-pyruvoyltetrahydropterin/6-carboxytetrahydropterin synthase